MKITTEIICPYCGFKNEFTAGDVCGRELYACDAEEGGCDGMFVIKYSVYVRTAVKCIEGEPKHSTHPAEEISPC